MQRGRLVLGLIDSFNDHLGRFVSFWVVAMAGVVMYEVVARYAFNSPTTWADESAQLIFAVYLILGGGYAMLRKEHIRMDILYNKLSPRTRAILDLVTSVFLFLFVGTLLWMGAEQAGISLAAREHSWSAWAPPLYPVRLAIPIGCFAFLLQALATFIRDLITARRGREAE